MGSFNYKRCKPLTLGYVCDSADEYYNPEMIEFDYILFKEIVDNYEFTDPISVSLVCG